MRKILQFLIALYTSIFLFSCSSSNVSDLPMRSGFYFDATVNNTKVIRIKNKQSIKSLQAYSRVSSVIWQLENPISGNLSIKISDNKRSKEFVGALTNNLQTQVVPLQPVELDTTAQLHKNNSVRVNGSAVITQKNMLNKNKLPVGEYVFRLKVTGTDNWDRKEVYVRVK